MRHSLNVIVHAGTEPGPLRLELEGCLTETSCEGLINVLTLGEALQGCNRMWIDLFSADHLDPAAIRKLKHYARQREAETSGPQISVYAPSVPRHCCSPLFADSVSGSSRPLSGAAEKRCA
ncbi:hypothetical protein A6035_00900 [Dietzia lutea]|uniref:STAS domain-containing protein n=1 Tax=Dietzia lutea TaxID=546160 RepID=A0A2S1R3Y6_9ACTN|nr:hypothetical protein A6035_00900 [Dietzia lutea]